jgi:hypothetical protein
MFPVIGDFFSSFFGGESQDYKKNDDAQGFSEDVCIQLLESNSAEDFIEETRDYYKSVLEGRELEFVKDLKVGMARVGNGIDSEIFWWAPVEHPVGAMLQYNQLEPICSVSHKHCGKLVVYPDAQVRFCIENIAQMLKDHRNIILKSDEEKEPDTKADFKNDNNKEN